MLHDLEVQLIKGEGQHLEFKFELNSARKIAATLSAFANAGGGTLLIGIKDNGAVAGIRLDEEIYVLQAAAAVYCQPEIIPQYTRHELKGKVVLEVEIEESRSKPVSRS